MKTILHTTFLVWALSAVTFAQGTAISTKARSDENEYARKWALIVGINYTGAAKVSKLNNPENDALAISTLLTNSYGFECELLLGNEKGKEATAATIKSKLTKLEKQVGEKDCFLFYFAGHGTPRGDMPLLYPADVEVDGIIANALPASEVIRTEIQALHSLYIFDSCYSGQIAKLDRFPPLNQTKIREGAAAFEGRAIQILTSAASNQTAKDGANGHSPFARAFMDGFKDRISVTDLHTYISGELKGQEPRILSLIPDQNAPVGGEFYFIGKAPKAVVDSLVFQTLPGTCATLPGSPLPQSWFDERPWLTPAVRLVVDQELGGNPSRFALNANSTPKSEIEGTRPVAELSDQARRMIDDKTLTFEKHARDIFERLKGLGEGPSRGEGIRDILSMVTKDRDRVPQPAATELHTLALLEAARQKSLPTSPEDKDLVELHNIFLRAVEAYKTANLVGLRARCLADHAQWLMERCPKSFQSESNEQETRYKLAISYFDDAGELVRNAPGTERFQIELHASAAYAMRQRAKTLVAESATNDLDPRKNRREAMVAWKDAASRYDRAMKTVIAAKFPETDPIFAYLHHRLGWLHMDLWEVKAAQESFSLAAKHDSDTDTESSSFLNQAKNSLGLAMAKRLTGNCAKPDLTSIQNRLLDRVASTKPEDAGWMLLQEALGNVTERLAECDFLEGGSALIDSSIEFKRGLEFCESWRDAVNTGSEQQKVDEQELRFLCKLIVISTLLNDDKSRKRYEDRYENMKGPRTQSVGVTKVLCDLANEFAAYGQAKFDNKNVEGIQQTLDKIRSVVHQNATAALDRESAELLLMIASALSFEQQRLDAKIRLNLLPKDPSGRLPTEMPKAVRRQYDEVILLEGRTYSGRVSSTDFELFRERVKAVRQMKWSNDDLRRPFVNFFLPLDGSNGLVIISYGANDPQQRDGQVYNLDFGWKNAPKEFSPRLQTILHKVLQCEQKPKIAWTDALLEAEGFTAPCPLSSDGGAK